MSATATALTEAEELEETEESPRRGRVVVLAVAAVLLAATTAWWLLSRGGDAEDAPPEEGLVVEVSQMTVNLAGDDLHYVRFAFALVLEAGAVPSDVEPRYPLLKDAALSIAQGFTQDELRTPEGSGRFRTELTRAAQAVYPDGPVLRAVLTELLVQ